MRDENDKLKIDIQRVLQVFTQNEMGNKVTQFNMMGLTNMLLGVIDGTVVVKQQAPKAPAPIETHRVDLPEKKELPKMEEAAAPKKLEDLEPEIQAPQADIVPPRATPDQVKKWQESEAQETKPEVTPEVKSSEPEPDLI